MSQAPPAKHSLAEALQSDRLSKLLGASVLATRVVDAHDGTTGRAVLELDTLNDTLPPRLFAKFPPEDEMQRAFVTSAGMGKREALFYEVLSSEVPVRVPRSYAAHSDEEGEDYLMLLEHLVDSDCTFDNASSRYSLEYVKQVLNAFASLHAAYWDSPRFSTDLSWVEPPLQHEIAIELVGLSLDQHADAMPAVFREMADLYLSKADAIHQLWRRGTPTLIHGDVHDGNLFYDGDQPGFLDWALVAQAPAMRDIGYFLAGTLSSDDQRNAAGDLLAHYRNQLQMRGIEPPSLEELWQQYQWHAAYVWVGATVTLAMGDAWQPVSYVMASLERLHDAMETIGSVEAIRSAL
ncbi:phosphotransferase [Candidatus Marimicrobium litorale]|uniref:DUF1679 domain-containing protein n=1 Tax=Candidatus Marimicrobium litorale TaxID=2518991 RepID=A0ABT3T1Z7_9GAMM|nr:phosphotransferase [Candidatus Marimicrobium litorale]MCX2976129.1 DUF1679 domain-containing protein [Candidatus Marimicrobium litorale]